MNPLAQAGKPEGWRAALLDLGCFTQPGAAELPVVEDLREAFAIVREDVFAPHRHDYFEVFVVRSGRATVWLEIGEQRIAAPCVCLLPPGAVHAWRAGVQIDGYILRIPSSALQPLQASVAVWGGGTRLGPLAAQGLQRIEPLVRWLREELAAEPAKDLGVVRAQLHLLILELARAGQPLQPSADGLVQRALFERFAELVEVHYHEHWTVQEYAARLRVGRARLARATQIQTGRAPAQVLQDRVMLEARRRVAHTDLRLGQISDALGFPSQAYFCRVFRRATRLAPSEFRRRAMRGTD